MGSGRKERYSAEAYAEVIRLIGEGVPLSDALGGPDRPGKTAFYQRLKEDPSLNRDYETVLSMRASCRIDALLDVNARLLEGRIDPQSARVISDNLKFLAGKEDRARWGEVSRTELTGRDGKDLLSAKADISDFELARLISFIMGRGAQQTVDGGDLVAIESEAHDG